MSEVKRYSEGPVGKGIYSDPNGELCGFHHLERVTAERDAALAAEQFVIAENKALQQRLTSADERADLLEGLLRKAAWFVRMSGTDAEIDAIDAALKPAEGGGDET